MEGRIICFYHRCSRWYISPSLETSSFRMSSMESIARVWERTLAALHMSFLTLPDAVCKYHLVPEVVPDDIVKVYWHLCNSASMALNWMCFGCWGWQLCQTGVSLSPTQRAFWASQPHRPLSNQLETHTGWCSRRTYPRSASSVTLQRLAQRFSQLYLACRVAKMRLASRLVARFLSSREYSAFQSYVENCVEYPIISPIYDGPHTVQYSIWLRRLFSLGTNLVYPTSISCH